MIWEKAENTKNCNIVRTWSAFYYIKVRMQGPSRISFA